MVVKVAMITPHKVRCGIHSYSRDLIGGLVQHGVEVYVVRWPRFGTRIPAILQKVVNSIPVDRVDLVHVQNEYGLFYGVTSPTGSYSNLIGDFYQMLSRIDRPVVSTMHAAGNIHFDGISSKLSDEVIVHNEYCKRLFRYTCTVIAHGAKPVETPGAEASKDALYIPQKKVVGYCGFVSRYKGLEMLVDAVTGVPDVALLIGGGWHVGGDTGYIANLKRRSLELLPSRCAWLGWVPDERMPLTYGAMDVVVYPSLQASESGALINALSHGRAVIASDIPPFREKEEAGALMIFKDREDLTSKIKRVLGDDGLRRELEEGARRYCEATSWDVVAGEHVELYRRVMGG